MECALIFNKTIILLKISTQVKTHTKAKVRQVLLQTQHFLNKDLRANQESRKRDYNH